MPLTHKGSRMTRARTLGLAAATAMLATLLTAGVALGHHAVPVVLQIDCNGNVSYTVYDWTTSTGTSAQATFDISYQANGGGSWIPLGTGEFKAGNAKKYLASAYPAPGNVWVVTGSFNVDSSVTSVVLRTDEFVWANGTDAPGPWYSETAKRIAPCPTPTPTPTPTQRHPNANRQRRRLPDSTALAERGSVTVAVPVVPG